MFIKICFAVWRTYFYLTALRDHVTIFATQKVTGLIADAIAKIIAPPYGETNILVVATGIGHDKFALQIFSTPPQSVTFVIRLPALRPADLRVSPVT